MRLLAFYAPYPGAGKTLAARWVALRLGMYRASFAAPLRVAAHDVITYPRASIAVSSPDDKEAVITHLGVSWRDVMIAFGNAGRILSPDFWVRIMERRFRAEPGDYVVDDLRFQNEYTFLRGLGAKIVRIVNPGRKPVITATEARLEWNDFDAVISNTKENLREYLIEVERTARELLQAKK